jgi:hypothetical protein
VPCQPPPRVLAPSLARSRTPGHKSGR